MKLELKTLATYLPYNLKGIIKNKVVVLDTLHQYSCETVPSVRGFTWCGFENFKPILRPLSDLTKEIEVNGKKFVPIEKVQDWNTSIDFAKEFEALLEDERWLSTTSYLLVELLFEWHFDVFGLIEKGLAIDINTLEL
jgi:hypothetical protein